MMGRELTFLPRREAASGRRIAAHYAAPIGIKAPEFRRRVPFARTGTAYPDPRASTTASIQIA